MSISNLLLIWMTLVVTSTCQKVSGPPVDEHAGQSQPLEPHTFVKRRGLEFIKHEKPFRFVGVNAYWMIDVHHPEETVESFLRQVKDQNISVVRTWAFNTGLPAAPGQYDEEQFQRLDYIVSHARTLGLHLILCLGNYWHHYRGPEDYVTWAMGDIRGRSVLDFYSSEAVQSMFRSHISTMLNRRNHLSHIPYKDDPTIMAWNIINEPRCSGCNSAGADLLLRWVAAMAQHIRQAAPHQLVSVSTEGFFSLRDGQGLNRWNPGPVGQCDTIDWVKVNMLPDIDFSTLHIYPEHMRRIPSESPLVPGYVNCDWPCTLQWLDQYIAVHEQLAAQTIIKPMVIEETGVKSPQSGFTEAQRREWFHLMLVRLMDSQRTGGALAGVMAWNAVLQGYPDYDGYNVYVDINMRDAGGSNGEHLGAFRRDPERNACVWGTILSGWRPTWSRRNVIDLGKVQAQVNSTRLMDMFAVTGGVLSH